MYTYNGNYSTLWLHGTKVPGDYGDRLEIDSLIYVGILVKLGGKVCANILTNPAINFCIHCWFLIVNLNLVSI